MFLCQKNYYSAKESIKLPVTNGNETYRNHPTILIPVSCNCVSEVYNVIQC